MIIGITSQIAKENSWSYNGPSGAANETISRGNLTRCETDPRGALNFLDTNYPASNYSVGYMIKLTSTSGFFPNQVICGDQVFIVV